MADRTFQGRFYEPSEEQVTPLPYFKLFLKDEFLKAH